MDKIIIQEFNNTRYGAYPALPSPEHFFLDKVYLYKIFKLLKKNFSNSSARVLEIGCADGSYSKFLMDKGFNMTGLDISKDAVEIAKQNGVNALSADVEDGLPFTEEYFDAVIACETIEHLYDTDAFIKEIKRVLKSGGLILLSTPNLASLKNRLRLLVGLYPKYSEYRLGDDTSGHIRNYTSQTLTKQLLSQGFSEIRIISPNIWFPMTKNIAIPIKKIAIRLGDFFYSSGSHLIAVSKKP